MDLDPRLQEFFLASRGGGQHGPKKLERRPGGPRGSTRGGPVLRRRRSRITAYLQWILSTRASQEEPLKIALGTSANIRRSRITAYMAAPALRTEIWNRIAAYLQCPVNSCRGPSGHRGGPLRRSTSTDDADHCIFTMDPDLRFTARRKYAVAMALSHFDPRPAGQQPVVLSPGDLPKTPTLRGQGPNTLHEL